MLQRFRDLSFRYKVPLRACALVVITACLVTVSMISKEYDELRSDLLSNSASLGRVLSLNLVAPLLHDDAWRAFEIISTPLSGEGDNPLLTAEVILVLDPQRRVYVSTQPTHFQMLSDPARVSPEFRIVKDWLAANTQVQPTQLEPPESDRIFVITPISADGVDLGTLVMQYSKSVFLPRFYSIAQRAALITLLVVAVLIPVSWWWGRRMAEPLVRLADGMAKVGPRIPEDREIALYESKDEIGRVGVAFRRMLGELREKENLEREVVVSDRLAALGRLAAGIAHEINNPLGGMLNAISTYKRHGNDDNDAFTTKTLSLLERGLLQIKNTVGALLVEAQVKSHPLSPQDIDDIQTLVLADAHRKQADLTFANDLRGVLPLPSTLVRQILMNLTLNAVQAVHPQGHVYVRAYIHGGSLSLLVKNNGTTIPAEVMPHLFEPFAHQSESGHGLGLWVTYQIVQQLKGEISVQSAPGETRFTVELPLPQDEG